MNKKRKHADYQEYLLERLEDPEFALGYLNEALNDEDQRIFLIALKNVIDAQGENMSALAEYAQLSRPNLYRILSEKGNPKLTSIRSLLSGMGLKLAIQPDKRK